ncbi:dual specificity protein phosphatase 12 isoform X2 [Eublepharis macularius]|uniref:Dual specificity protein phosphatase 12 n=1 Tax=Eublepharis macularius TaxID=481883 RepID=A0AA97LKI6_EUBMA|nr:dual specificity protein phosphatase 12 isoform X2 [Eublepharis macularius]
MVPVLPGLYLGCGLPGAEEVGRGGVTALLSVDSEPPGAAAEAALEAVLHVPLLDEPRSDLLSRLDDCAAFVGRARERGGAVLVRCHSGVSRSVAVVTAYLMKANHLPFEEAYAFVRALRPEAKMNEGFEWQLKLYEKMGCEVDVTSSIYKQYCLQKVTEKYPGNPLCSRRPFLHSFSKPSGGEMSYATCHEMSLQLTQALYLRLQVMKLCISAGSAGKASALSEFKHPGTHGRQGAGCFCTQETSRPYLFSAW